jgi:methylmalonyl-CoA mutase N-terminal domain/subunit
VLGGTQSLHTNSFDEAIALPTEKAARLALRTQQVIAYETDVPKTVDPLAGSYAIEHLTDETERKARELMAAVEERGGAVAAIEQGFQKAEIEKSAYSIAMEIENDERIVVGVNKYKSPGERYEPLRVDPTIEQGQRERLEKLRAERDGDEVEARLDDLRKAAQTEDQNLLYPMKEALRARATVGEISNALRDVWGLYSPPDAF